MALPYYLRVEIDTMLQDIGATAIFWYSDSTPKPTEGNGNTLYIKTDLSEISTWSGSEYSNKNLDLSVYTPNGGNTTETAQSLRDDIDAKANDSEVIKGVRKSDGTLLTPNAQREITLPESTGGTSETDNELKTYQIPESELSATPTSSNIKTLVAEWIAVNATNKLDIQTIAWEVIQNSTTTQSYVDEGYVESDYSQ